MNDCRNCAKNQKTCSPGEDFCQGHEEKPKTNSRLFKRRQFAMGKLVDIKVADEADPHKIVLSILDLIKDKRMWSIGGGSVTGRGIYEAFHESEHAREIERHLKQLVKNIKNKES